MSRHRRLNRIHILVRQASLNVRRLVTSTPGAMATRARAGASVHRQGGFLFDLNDSPLGAHTAELPNGFRLSNRRCLTTRARQSRRAVRDRAPLGQRAAGRSPPAPAWRPRCRGSTRLFSIEHVAIHLSVSLFPCPLPLAPWPLALVPCPLSLGSLVRSLPTPCPRAPADADCRAERRSARNCGPPGTRCT